MKQKKYLMKEIKQNELISNKHKKVGKTLIMQTLTYFSF